MARDVSPDLMTTVLDRLTRVESETAEQNLKLTELYTLYLKARGARWLIVTVAGFIGSVATIALMALGIFMTSGGY